MNDIYKLTITSIKHHVVECSILFQRVEALKIVSIFSIEPPSINRVEADRFLSFGKFP